MVSMACTTFYVLIILRIGQVDEAGRPTDLSHVDLLTLVTPLGSCDVDAGGKLLALTFL